ncbi:hypothetical protein COCVIDRAFT_33263 [Bipolaris victoriae FI3]|uniref:Uncharacterized protein n=1 Tax=Bipolaris victoriae (strain FI3) TaxID=930091 RepID=W7EZP9_BIPV3|nr:hypothetical protein COCVIDRAFT_33263 [Bipolaris victoriae FI3]
MPEFSDTPPAAHQISLLLHTAVDFGLNSGVGIGIIQSTAPGVGLPLTLPTEEQAHGIERGQARAKNLTTPERAHMFALILAIGLACSTIRRKCTATQQR